ncbi:MAG: winged helix-turn-helix transcriptional regulator [Shimia sp.]
MKTPVDCPVEGTLRILTGKWPLFVLFHLAPGPLRFNALQRALAPITQKVLTTTLRRLEEDRLIWRRSEGTVPPRVTYGLTEAGAALAPVWAAMGDWGATYVTASDEGRPDPAPPPTQNGPDRVSRPSEPPPERGQSITQPSSGRSIR